MDNWTKYFIFVFLIIHFLFFKNEAQTNVIRSIEYKQISSFEENMGISNMKMSSDGTKIIFATGGYTRKVFTINSDGSSLKLIYDFQNTGFGPFVDINADGSKIIWCDYIGTGEIFISNSDGSSTNKIVTLLPNPDPNFADMKPEIPVPPRITADGNTVYFIHNHRDPRGTGVWKVYSDGSNLQQVFNFSNMAIELFGRNVNEFWTTSFSSGFDISANAEAILVGTPFFKIEESDYNRGDLVVFTNGTFYHLDEYAVGNQPFSISKDGNSFLVFRREYIDSLGYDVINIVFTQIGSGEEKASVKNLDIFGISQFSQIAGETGTAIVLGANGRLPISYVDRISESYFDLVSIDAIGNYLGGFGFSSASLPSINWNGNKFCFLSGSANGISQIWIASINSNGITSIPSISEVEFLPSYVTVDKSIISTFKVHAISAPNTIELVTFEAFKDEKIQYGALKSDWPYNGILVDNGEFGDESSDDHYFTNNSVQVNLPETPIGDYTIRIAALNSTLKQITMIDAEPFFILDEPNSIDVDNQLSTDFYLYQNYPNPFNPTTKIKYSIPQNVKSEKSNVKLVVFDILGREVSKLVNQKQKPGNYEVEFDARNLPSGIYFYKLRAKEFTLTKRMILLK